MKDAHMKNKKYNLYYKDGKYKKIIATCYDKGMSMILSLLITGQAKSLISFKRIIIEESK